MAKYEKHWSEASGEWYYVGTVGDQWDYIRHEVEPEGVAGEMDGMFLLYRDGTVRPAPATHDGWRFLADTTDPDADDPACVGRIVDGVCVPIGGDEDEEEDDGPDEPTVVIDDDGEPD